MMSCLCITYVFIPVYTFIYLYIYLSIYYLFYSYLIVCPPCFTGPEEKKIKSKKEKMKERRERWLHSELFMDLPNVYS